MRALLVVGLLSVALGACQSSQAGRYQLHTSATQNAISVHRIDTHTGVVHRLFNDELHPVRVLD